jgi:hypothetical protein
MWFVNNLTGRLLEFDPGIHLEIFDYLSTKVANEKI